MHFLWKGPLLAVAVLFCVFASNGAYAKKKYKVQQPYRAKIIVRPDDVSAVKCGGDFKLTCVAEGKPVPEIEWWFHNQEKDENGLKSIIRHAGRDGRVKIKTEELMVVRSTIYIRDADESDEGMYQCRASNSAVRKDRGINVYQHWKIEEVPVNKVMCKETVLTKTEVYPASKYNQSVFTEAAERAMSSVSFTSSTPTEKNLVDEETSLKTSQMTSSTTIMTVKPIISPKPTHPGKNSVHKPKKDVGKKISKNVIEKEKKKNVVGLQKKAQREVQVSGTTLEQSGNGDGNSGVGVYHNSWTMILLHLPVVAFVLLTSSC